MKHVTDGLVIFVIVKTQTLYCCKQTTIIFCNHTTSPYDSEVNNIVSSSTMRNTHNLNVHGYLRHEK